MIGVGGKKKKRIQGGINGAPSPLSPVRRYTDRCNETSGSLAAHSPSSLLKQHGPNPPVDAAQASREKSLKDALIETEKHPARVSGTFIYLTKGLSDIITASNGIP